jgi:dynein heavy chain
MEIANKLTAATIAIWDQVKSSFIPTPQKFH